MQQAIRVSPSAERRESEVNNHYAHDPLEVPRSFTSSLVTSELLVRMLQEQKSLCDRLAGMDKDVEGVEHVGDTFLFRQCQVYISGCALGCILSSEDREGRRPGSG